MATSIDILDDQFIVSYNFLGSDYKGGVDFISNTNNLLNLESQIELGASDVSDSLIFQKYRLHQYLRPDFVQLALQTILHR